MAEGDQAGEKFAFPWRFVRSLALIYIAVVVLVYLLQRRMQYLPDAAPVPAPRGEAYRGLETVELKTSDGLAVIGWYWPGERQATLVIFHGNAGNRGGGRLDWIEEFHARGFGVFILDYRGYGGSEGSPTEAGLYRDAEAALDWLASRGAPGLVYFGESLGCGVAVEMAVRRPPRAMVLQSSFSSMMDVARKHYFYLPVRFLMKDRYDCSEKIGKASCPLLLIHGENDSIIPIEFGRALFDAAPEPKEWLAIPNADHNELPWTGGKKYYEGIDDFVRRRVDGPGAGAGAAAK